MTTGVDQSSSPGKDRAQKIEYTFIVRVASTGEHNVTFLAARRPAEENRPQDGYGLFEKSKDEESYSEGFKQGVVNTSVVYTINPDGTLATIQCSSSATEDKEACDSQTLVVRQALKTVNVVKAPTTATGLVQIVPATVKDVRGKDKLNGHYTRNHVQREHTDGLIHLKVDTSYDLLQVGSQSDGTVEVSTPGAEGRAETAGVYAKYKNTADVYVDPETNRISKISSTDSASFGPNTMGADTPSGTQLMQMNIKLREGETQGRAADEVAPMGKTGFVLTFDLELSEAKADKYVHVDSPTARLMQIDQPFQFNSRASEAKMIDISKAIDDLAQGKSNAGHLVFILDDRPDAIEPLDKAFMKFALSHSIDDWMTAEKAMERYLTLLAAVKQPQAETVLLKHLTDSKMHRTFPKACTSAMVSMMIRPKRAEHVHGALLNVARTSKDEHVRDQALLVLGGLLSAHAAAPPAWAEKIYDHVVGHTENNGEIELPVAISAVGNTKWQRAEPTLAKYLATDDEFVLHNAVDGLARLPKLSATTGGALANVLAQRDRWANHTSVLPRKMLQLLQSAAVHTAPRPATDFDNKMNWQGANKITFFSRVDEISRSDFHTANTRATVELSQEFEGDDNNLKLAFVASGALEGSIYSYRFTRDGGNAILELGFTAIYAKADGATKQTWKKGIFLDAMGIRIKSWGSIKTEDEEKAWKARAVDALKYTAANAGKQLWGLYMGTDKKTEPPSMGSICAGNFDFAKAALNGISQNETHGGIVIDVNYVQRIFTFSKTFCWWIACVNVRFMLDGTLGVQPALAWGSGGAPYGCRGTGKTWMGGLRPYGKLDATVEIALDLLVVRVGVGGNVNLITIGFPLYGRYVTGYTEGKTCGSVEFEVDAFSGRLYIFIDYYDWWSWWGGKGWQRAVDFTIVEWNGWYYSRQLFPTDTTTSPAYPACSVCTWKKNCVHRHHIHHSHHQHHWHHAHHNHHGCAPLSLSRCGPSPTELPPCEPLGRRCRHHSHHRHFWGRRRLLTDTAQAALAHKA
jgi:hypothetical protein